MIIVLFSCKKNNTVDNTEQAKLAKSKEIRESLSGEVIFLKDLTIRIAEGKMGGTGTLLESGDSGIGPKWSPDGLKIAYIRLLSDSEAGASNWYLTIIDKQGTQKANWLLGSLSSIYVKKFTWSSDGTIIAFLCLGNILGYINTNSGEITMTQLEAANDGRYTCLAWRPNTNQIAISGMLYNGTLESMENSIRLFEAFDNNPESNLDNLIVAMDITSGLLSIEFMDWSIDGSKLVFSDEGFGSIFIVNYDGSENREIILRDLYKDEIIYGFAPCWSINGRQIVFTSATGVSGTSLIPGLFVTDIDGSYKVDIKIPGELPDWY